MKSEMDTSHPSAGLKDQGGAKMSCSEDEGGSGSGSESDDDEVAVARAMALVASTPTSLEAHKALIEALRLTGDLARLRAAREAADATLELTEDLWISWLDDEIKLAKVSHDSKARMLQTLEMAVARRNTPQIWNRRLLFLSEAEPSLYGETVRDAVEACGYNLIEGHLVWAHAVTLNEQALLIRAAKAPVGGIERADVVAKVVATMCAKDAEEISKAAEEAEAFRDKCKEFILKEPTSIKHWLSQAEALSGKTKQLSLSRVDKSKIVFAWLERGLARYPAARELWEQYITSTLKSGSTLFFPTIAKRAFRAVPSESGFARAAIQAAETECKGLSELAQQVGEVLYYGLAHVDASPHSSSNLLLTSCDAYRRLYNTTQGDKAVEVQARQQYAYALQTIQSMFPQDAQGMCRIVYAHCEFLNHVLSVENSGVESTDVVGECEKLWNKVIDTHPNNLQAYMQAIQFCRSHGNLTMCRKLLKRGLHTFQNEKNTQAGANATRKIASLWIEIESRSGTLHDLMDAQKSTANILNLFSDQRENKSGDMEKMGSFRKEGAKPQTKKRAGAKSQAQVQDRGPGQSNKRPRTEMTQDVSKTSDTGLSEKEKKALSFKQGVFVVNLAYTVTEEQLRKHFEVTCGPVASVSIKRGRRGESKGCGTVSFQSVRAAERALAEQNGTLFCGRALNITELKPLEQRQSARLQSALETDVAQRTVYIGNIPPEYCTEKDFCAGSSDFALALRSCGDLDTIRIAPNKASATVRFVNLDAAKEAIKLNHQTFKWPSHEEPITAFVHPFSSKASPPAQQVSKVSKAKSTLKPSVVSRKEKAIGSRKPRLGQIDLSKAKLPEKSPVPTKPDAHSEEKASDTSMKSNAYFASLFKPT